MSSNEVVNGMGLVGSANHQPVRQARRGLALAGMINAGMDLRTARYLRMGPGEGMRQAYPARVEKRELSRASRCAKRRKTRETESYKGKGWSPREQRGDKC